MQIYKELSDFLYDNILQKEAIIFHSDQGSQFKSASLRKILDEHQLLASSSKPGSPYDKCRN